MKKVKNKKVCAKHVQRVFVGMSGGVDSSVSAALLKKAGFEVVGVFIKIWEPSFNSSTLLGTTCDWREERREARRVAAHLEIPLLTLDLSREYKKRVVDYFIAEYKTGRTPNPDVMCNKHIKFGVFYDWAMAHEASACRQAGIFVATGHYARIATKPSFCFAKATDQDKDQTYFLWNLKSNQLSKILFPVGGYTKTQVRALAKKFGLPNADKKDSQGLCFIGKIDFKDFLKKEIKEKLGNVLTDRGEVIGQHNGVMFFTLGERHGFTVFAKKSNEKPYYVIAKDIKKNTLTVSQNPHTISAEKLAVKIEKTNWISKLPAKSDQLQARTRYRQPLQPCHLTQIDKQKSIATIIFTKPQLAVAGQSLVFYDKNVCLGGGIII